MNGQRQIPTCKRLLTTLLLLLCCAAMISCNSSHSYTQSNSTVETNQIDQNPSKMSFEESEKQRLESLLKDFRHPLSEIAPQPSSESLGALWGRGYEVNGQDIQCMVYLYNHQSEHAAVFERLAAQLPEGAHHPLPSSNGALLFYGYQLSADPKATYVLNDLASAFAGEE